MAELDNLYREHFCVLIARGMDHTRAFQKARDPSLRPAKNVKQSAYGLLKNPEIQARIAELKKVVQTMRAESAARMETIAADAKIDIIERQWVIAELKDNVRRAKKDDTNLAVANRALELLGKEIGMFIDRSENYNVNNEIRSEPLTEKEWAEQFAGNQSKPN